MKREFVEEDFKAMLSEFAFMKFIFLVKRINTTYRILKWSNKVSNFMVSVLFWNIIQRRKRSC